MVTFKTGDIYNFNTLYGSVLGSSFKNMYLESISSFNYAIKHADIVTTYKQIQDIYSIATGSDNFINMYKNDMYYIFKTSDNTTKVFASRWIDADTIEEVKTSTLEISIRDFTGLDYSRIEKALSDLGYRNITISVSGKNNYY